MHHLDEKVVIISGGGGLLGKAFVEAVVEYGGSVVIADFNEESGKRIEPDIKKKYPDSNVAFFPLDINSKSSIQSLIQFTEDKYGTIHAVVNSAYPKKKNYGAHFFDVEYNDFCENVNLHLGGYFLVLQQFAYYFKHKKQGNIINIASIQGVVAPKFDTYDGTSMTSPVEYTAIKSSIIRLTEYIAKYCSGYNIRCNTISPGGILDKQPEAFLKKYRSKCLSKGMLNPEDLKGTLIFLLSDMSRYVNGQNIIVDDGFCI